MKILKRIIIGVLVLIILLVLVLVIYLRGTKPVLSGKYTTLNGSTTGKILIERDKWGVPLIEAENREDMFWAMGFVHASDRLFQMDLIRRLSTGRLSEVFGRRALESDKEQMDLMIVEGIERSVGSIDPKLKKIIDSYCRGVNYYIDNCPLPPEFKLLGYSPGPWITKDIIAVFKRMELILAGSGSELYNMKVYAALDEKKGSELLRGSHGTTIINSNEYKNFMDNITLSAAYEREFENIEKLIGSNNWVISGKITKSGNPILCNDPHLSNVFPSYFYQVYLKSKTSELSGNSIPGIPFIIIGRNSKISWGFTNVGTDVIDYYILKTEEGDEENYILDGKKTKFKILEKRIKIKGEEDYLHKVLVSEFGPVMRSDRKYIARHSTNEYSSTVLNAFYGMNFAANYQDFLKALKMFSSPAQNVVFSDNKGNIGYYPTGSVPIRAAGDGSLPLDGDTKRNLWKGFYDEEKKPFVINPEKGFMVSANNRVIPENGIPVFAKDWYPSFRGDRIAELIAATENLTIEDNIKFQIDTYLKSAEFMLGIIKSHKTSAKESSFVLDRLLKWNKRADSGAGPVLFYRFEKHLSREMFSDEFSDEESRSLVSRSWIYRILNYPEGDCDKSRLEYWADDKNSIAIEKFENILERSLVLTYADYIERPEDKQKWPDAHALLYKHPLGSVFPLKYFVNRGPFPIKGGKDCIMVSSFRNRDDFNTAHLSTFRMIIDMGDHANSKMINSSGQSGHFMSKFYDDQIKLYTEGRYRSFENPPVEKYRIEIVPE